MSLILKRLLNVASASYAFISDRQSANPQNTRRQMAADSADIPLRVWVLKGGFIGATLMCMGYIGVLHFAIFETSAPEVGPWLTEHAEFVIYFFLFLCVPALPTALLVGLAHRGLCRLFPREHKSIFAATLVGTWVIVCFFPSLGYSFYIAKKIWIGWGTGESIVFFGFIPSLAAVVATTVVLRR